MIRLTLASSSPQRSALLDQYGIAHLVVAPQLEERIDTQSAKDAARRLAEKKCRAIIPRSRTELVLSADTVVEFRRRIYGKPADKQEAFEMLKALSGNTHRVHTAICLYSRRTEVFVTRVSSSKVTFAALSQADLRWYLDTEEWRGAAGAYRIQAKGERLVKRICGNYSSVSGLPIHELFDILASHK